MNNGQNNFNSILNKIDNEDPFDLGLTLRKYIFHWRYFLVSILLTLSGAFVYLQFAKPIYEIKATLLVQDDKKASEEKSVLQEIEISNSPKLVENEIEVLKSRNLILQVVNELQLWTSYQKSEGFQKIDLYEASPVQFKFLKRAVELKGQELEIEIKDLENFILKNTKGERKKFLFTDSHENELGTWKLEPIKDISQYLGTTIHITLHNPERVTYGYQNGLEVFLLNKNAPVVGLSLFDEVEQRGIDFLNTLIDFYNTAAVLEKSRLNQSTLHFIDQRLSLLSGELNNTEKQVEGYRSSQGLTDISSQSQVYLQNVQVNDNRLNEVNVQLNIIEGIEAYLNAAENSKNFPSVLSISDPGLNHLIQQLSELQLQKQEFLATTPEENPIFNPINRQINSTKSAIKENIGNIKAALFSSKKEMESFNTKFEASIRNIPSQERQLINIKRQQTIKEDLYIYLLKKREELSLSYAATLTDARVVDSAYAGPVNEPKKLLILATALILGLIFPVGLIFAKDRLSTRVTTRKEIEAAIKAPILIELPMVRKPNPIVVYHNSRSAISEQFRSLRTYLQFLHNKKENGRVTLLTSSISEEGKSFIVSNLGAALAASGRKTIIVELDLRIPGVSENFKLPVGRPGISNFLMKKCSIDEIIQPSDNQANLDVVVCGSIPSNPSELLELPELDLFFKYLQNTYDDILIDTPPIQLVTDAHILSRLTDVTLYIIRQGHTHKSLLPYIENLYEMEHFPKMNILFNCIQPAKYGYGNIYGKYQKREE